MKVSLLGPANLDKFSHIMNMSIGEIEVISKQIGKTLAENRCELGVVFNYSGMIKLVGDAYRQNSGKLEMLYTENDSDWFTDIYMKHLENADIKTKKNSWHEMLLSLTSDSDIVLCAGLCAGTLAELAYMKWNYQENKGKVKAIIGIKELLRNHEFPPEISFDMKKIIFICSVKDLDAVLKKI